MLRVYFLFIILLVSWSRMAFAESQSCELQSKKPVPSSSSSQAVNINTATVEELSSRLKGVGKAKAAAIIEWRETNGKFSSLEDLDEVKGIGAGIIEKNKNNIVFED